MLALFGLGKSRARQIVVSTLMGFLLFPVVLVVPGYVVGWMLDLFDFRRRLAHSRMAVAILLSFAISPILVYLPSSLVSFIFIFILLALFIFAFVAIVALHKPAWPSFTDLWGRRVIICSAIFAAVILFSIVDIQFGDNVYFSVAAFDHTTRVSILDAMTRTGVPPENPSYYPGHPVLLNSVYYFW